MTDITDFAITVARAAGDLLLRIRERSDLTGKALGDRGDAEANALILAMIRDTYPDDAILSEESRDDPVRLQRSRLWIIDPLDGTREYREGRSDWAVHIGLAIDGAAAIGAVALPAESLIFASNSDFPSPDPQRPRNIVVSRTRPPAITATIAQKLGATITPMGSAGAKAMAVVRGEADIYLHEGGQHEWDNCAPVAVAQAAGLHCSTLIGAALSYNKPQPTTPTLLICRAELASDVLALVSRSDATA